MNNKEDLNMKSAIEKWLDTLRLRQKYNESSIVNAWPDIIGRPIANRTQKIYINNKKLYIKVESAVVKHELSLMRKQIIGRVNEHVGRVIVEDLVILSIITSFKTGTCHTDFNHKVPLIIFLFHSPVYSSYCLTNIDPNRKL